MSALLSRRVRRRVALLTTALIVALLVPATAPAAVTYLEGTLTDAGDGWPAPEVGIDLRYWDAGTSQWFQQLGSGSGAFGYFGWEVPARTYRIRFYDPSGRYLEEVYHNAGSLDAGTDVPVAPGATATITEQLVRATGQIKGCLTDKATGAFVGGIEVTAFRWDAASASWVVQATRQTVSDGRYVFSGLPAGTYRLRFADVSVEWSGAYVSEYYNDKPDIASASSISVTAGMAPATCDAVLSPIASISGTVTEAMGAAPIAGCTVTAYDATTHDYAGSATTDATGLYFLYDLADGSYHLLFHRAPDADGGYVDEYYNDKPDIASANAVSVTAGTATIGVNAALTGRFVSLHGTVTSELTGEPLDFVDVGVCRFNGAEWELVDGTWTNDEGRWATYGLAADTYRLSLMPVGNRAWVGEWYNNRPDVGTATDIDFNGISAPAADSTLSHVSPSLARLSGADRYECAVGIARAYYDSAHDKTWVSDGGWMANPVNTIVLASGEDRAAADPLAASALCSANNAPLFLVSSTRTPASVLAASKEIALANGDVTIYVVGGPVSVPDKRVNEVRAAITSTGHAVEVRRVALSGDRYDLAAAIAKELNLNSMWRPELVLVANGEDPGKFFDALALSTVAAAQRAPILLVKGSSVPKATSDAIWHLTPKRVIVGGGPATVSSGVVTALKAERWSGANRYSTATTIADKAMSEHLLWVDHAVMASTLPDALTGGSAAGANRGALVLVTPGAVPGETGTWLESHDHRELAGGYVLGGTASVQAATFNTLKNRLALP